MTKQPSSTSIILDNILLIHESFQWVKELCQESIFLELDFNKVYDRVDWAYMFQVMGNAKLFIKMIRLLFYDATVLLNINP